MVFAAATCLMLSSSRGQGSLSLDRDRMLGILDQVSKEIEKNYYDPNLKGLDWKGFTAQAKQQIEKANTVGEMVTAIFVLLDKLQYSHTVFVPPPRVATALFGFEAKPFGNQILVYKIRKKGAADVAGLQLGDRILQVNGFNADPKTWDLMMEYFRVLRPVSAMEMGIIRGNEAPQKLLVAGKVDPGRKLWDLTDIDTIFQFIHNEDANSDSDDEKYHYQLDNEGIGYVQLRAFIGNEEFLDRLVGKIKNARATVVDLRGNLGGAETMLLSTVGHFESEPAAVLEVVRRKKTETLRAKPRKPILEGPMFILVDSETASSAEIFARHFQLSGRAKVIGDHTSGRVLEGQYFSRKMGTDVAILYGINIRVGRGLLPGGEDLEKRGVTPDVTCIPTAEQVKAGQDVCRAVAHTMAQGALGSPAKQDAKIEQKNP
jgi:carboxyl-terminal processing protease